MAPPPSYRPLPTGIYTPVPTFFQPTRDQELDLAAFRAHVLYTASSGTTPVIAGSAGEAPHLTAAERKLLFQTARSALDATPGLETVPVVAGVGAPSTGETIRNAADAAEAGADYAMVLPPGYYAGQLARDRAALRGFLVDVAEASPLPVVLYNFPAVTGGIDLDSDLIVDVVKASDNVVGVKLTCASVGKITRINAVLSSETFRKEYPRRREGDEFRIIDGYIDILLPSIASGAAGAISGLPNIAPRTCVKLWELSSTSATGSDDYREAQGLQGILALADGACQAIGIAGLKMLVHMVHGHPKAPRRPLLPMGDDEGRALLADEAIQAVLAEEKRLVSG